VALGLPGAKTAAPRIDETMVLDTKERRQMLQQAAAMGESMQFASARNESPDALSFSSGRTDQKEYVLTNKLTVIGKSAMATVRLKGWFKPQMAAQINQRDDGYYLRSRRQTSQHQRHSHRGQDATR